MYKINYIIIFLMMLFVSNAFAGNKSKVIQTGWYLRLISTSGDLKDKHVVFGYLQGASDQKDKYDNEARSSGGTKYLYTTIRHENFIDTNDYRSDYRAIKKLGSKTELWTVVVHCGDAYADVTLHWDGITWVQKSYNGNFREIHVPGKRILSKMKLYDKVNDQQINVKEENEYTFNMDGQHEHILQWILFRDIENKIFKVRRLKSHNWGISNINTDNKISDESDKEFHDFPSVPKRQHKYIKHKKHFKKSRKINRENLYLDRK